MKRVAVVGASVGGIVAAAELARRGHNVTVFDKGRSVGGLYATTNTPFGPQELGMHVLYMDPRQLELLRTAIGAEKLETWAGVSVDIGGARTFGRNGFDSVYPDLRGLPIRRQVLDEMLKTSRKSTTPRNASEAAAERFGHLGTEAVINPILTKLWGEDPTQLTPGALHCYFDLRRLVLVDKTEADKLKSDAWLDQVIANPDQLRPAAPPFGGRLAVRFRHESGDISSNVIDWMDRSGILTEFGAEVWIEDGELLLNGDPVGPSFDYCIVAAPIHSLISDPASELHQSHLFVTYLQVDGDSIGPFPSYYLLCHDADIAASRIVNFSAYADPGVGNTGGKSVIAVETLLGTHVPPDVDAIRNEVSRVFPGLIVHDAFQLARSVALPAPTKANAELINNVTAPIRETYGPRISFSGLRTDEGVFFSHQTVRLAHDAALEYSR